MNAHGELSARLEPGDGTHQTGTRALRERETNQARLDGTAQNPSAAYVWYVILLLCVVNVFSYMDRMALSVLLPSIKADLVLSDGQLGLLVGFAFFLFYAVCGIPVARWADRGIRRDIIAITLTVWSVMTALSGAAQNFWHLFAARVGLGAGEAGCIPSAQSIISDYVPLKKRSGVYALHTFGMSAGTMLGLILAGWLGEAVGWRWAFVVLGLPGIAVAILVRLTLREPRRGASDGVDCDEPSLPFRETLATLWRCRTYRLVVMFLVANGFVTVALLQWWPSFYGRVFGTSLSSIGAYLGLAVGAGAGIGTIIGGLVAHKAGQKDIGLPLMISAGAICLAIPAVLGSLFSQSSHQSMLLAGLTIMLWSVPSGPVTAAMYSVTKPRMRATASAVTIFFISVLGFGFGPLCVGVLSDLLTPSFGTEALRYALLLPACLLPLLIAALYRIGRALAHDLRAVGVSIS